MHGGIGAYKNNQKIIESHNDGVQEMKENASD